jgi:hypothetical protein
MESEGSLACSQEPSSGPYPEPDQSSASTHLRLDRPNGLFLLAISQITYMHDSSPPFVLHVLPISFSSTWSS